MKKKINLMLCILFCICFFNKNVILAADEMYNSEAIEELHELYCYNEPYLEILKKKEAFSYRMIADYYEKNKFMNWATNRAAFILGGNISEDDYIEILSEIITLNQYEISKQIEEQGKYNIGKNIWDFLYDAADVITDVEGISFLFNINDTKSKFICNTLNNGEKILSKGREFAELTEDGKKYYQVLLENYVSSDKFLTAVTTHANEKKLRNAARKMIKVNNNMFLKQYYYLDKMSGDITKYSGELFIDEIMEPASDFLLEYASDKDTKNILQKISSVGEKISTFKTTFNLMMFIGDYTFGTSDTFAYLQRIKAINDIASCISCEMDEIDIESYTDNIEQYEAIINKCTWYRWLITIDARGESYACAMLTDANNGLSDIDALVKMFKGELTIEEKYDFQLDALVRFDKNYLRTLLDIDVFRDEKSEKSENNDVIDKFLEFVKEYSGEVFYSIENIKEGEKPVLLLTFPSEDVWKWETLDDGNVYSSNCDIYDYVNGEVVQRGSLLNISGYLSIYRKENQDYVVSRNNSHSYLFHCVKDDSIYYYAYNTNNIQEDTVEYEEHGEYRNYAYGTTNYDNAINEYVWVGNIIFKKYAENNQNEISTEKNGFDAQILVDYYNSHEWWKNVTSTEESMYELVDIEQDGTPELVIRSGNDSPVSYYIYSYNKDTAQIIYSGTFDNGFNSTPALYYSPSMKALSTYGRTSDSHWDMFYQLENGEISLMSFETGWFDTKNNKYVRHYYISNDIEKRREIASADWKDDKADKEAAEIYYSYISDLKYITFGNLVYEKCYSHEEDMLMEERQHAIYVWNQVNEVQDVNVSQLSESVNDNYAKPTTEFIIQDSDCRYLTKGELINLTPQQCNYARNEIYARKGRKFHSIELQQYFEAKKWYVPIYEPEFFDENIELFCNDYEIKNGKTILEFESEHKHYELS